jgi:Na+-transporting NADH:ubiquinone oxidoreductase subunit C
MHASVGYNLGFAAAVCVVCAIVVSSAAVSLQELQEANEALEKQRNVLVAAGLASSDERPSPEEVDRRFESIRQVVIELDTGEEAADIDGKLFDQRAAAMDVDTSRAAPDNNARIPRLPHHALVYELRDADDRLELVILPISGMGLWSTLYGFVALDADLSTIRGLTYYEHGETPGLGGEVDNQRWKDLWPGRQAFDQDEVRIQVIRGRAGAPDADPYRVDGLAGATMTSRGVTNMLQFWLSGSGFGPYLDRLRTEEGV